MDQNPSRKPTLEGSLELFPDALQRLQLLKEHLKRADEQHWFLLSQAAHRDIELQSSRVAKS